MTWEVDYGSLKCRSLGRSGGSAKKLWGFTCFEVDFETTL